MAINEHAVNLVNMTVKAFNGEVTNVSPTDGLSLIDSWISFLHSDTQHDQSIDSDLNSLRAELQSGQLDSDHIQQLISNLSGQVQQVANAADTDSKPKLASLSEALQSFSQQINSESGPAKTGGQALMTSTVGGESARSGVGASAFAASGDDLSERNGGTVDNDQPDTETPDMDDTTGSDGGRQQERSSDETGDSGYTSTGSTEPRSDTGRRVAGMGISGGTGDTATTQSGGRSQY